LRQMTDTAQLGVVGRGQGTAGTTDVSDMQVEDAPVASQGLPDVPVADQGTVPGIGKYLYNPNLPYLFPFEVTSILLLVATIGAVVLAKRKLPGELDEMPEEVA